MKKIAFIINTIATKRKRFSKEVVQSFFKDKGYEILFYDTQYHQHARELTQQAIENNSDIIVAVGGSGTMNQTLQEVVKVSDQVKFAVFPTGNGNSYTNYTGLPAKLPEFLQALSKEHTKYVDVGEIEYNESQKRYFLGSCTIGATPLLAKECEGKAFHNYFSYVLRGFKVLRTYKPKTPISLRFNHYEETKPFYEILIGNVPTYKGNLVHQKYSSISDGMFHVSILEKISYSEVIQYGFQSIMTQSDELFNISDIYAASKIFLTLEEDMLMQTDFEAFEVKQGKIEIKNREKYLQLITPCSITFL